MAKQTKNTVILSPEKMDARIRECERKLLAKKLRVEECIVLDNAGNELIDVKGEKMDIDLTPYYDKILFARVLIHTHPSIKSVGNGLTDADMVSLSYFKLNELRACDRRFWYSAKRTKMSKDIPPDECERKYWEEYDKLYDIYFEKGEKTGDMSRAMFGLACAVSRKILNEYGYTYKAGEIK